MGGSPLPSSLRPPPLPTECSRPGEPCWTVARPSPGARAVPTPIPPLPQKLDPGRPPVPRAPGRRLPLPSAAWGVVPGQVGVGQGLEQGVVWPVSRPSVRPGGPAGAVGVAAGGQCGPGRCGRRWGLLLRLPGASSVHAWWCLPREPLLGAPPHRMCPSRWDTPPFPLPGCSWEGWRAWGGRRPGWARGWAEPVTSEGKGPSEAPGSCGCGRTTGGPRDAPLAQEKVGDWPGVLGGWVGEEGHQGPAQACDVRGPCLLAKARGQEGRWCPEDPGSRP